MDPHMEWEERNENILGQIFEHLLEMDIDGNPYPCLAKRWKRLGKLIVQFTLNKNIYFHNGEPCDAYAVKYSIERNLKEKPKAPNYHVIKSIKRVDVIDRYTFNIVTHYPDGILINRLCQSGFIVPPKYIQKVGDRGFEKHPIGTGPFKFVRWIKGKEIVLEKNESYWKRNVPSLDGIIFRFADSRKRVEMLLAGELDMITNFEPKDLKRMDKQGFKILKEPSFTTMVINFNLRKGTGPLQDKRVRQAMNYAVNVNGLIEEVLLGNGIRRATLGMPGEFGYNPYIKPYPYDPRKARELLREAGYPNGFDATILIDDIDGGAASIFGKALKSQLAGVGINLRIEGGSCVKRIVEPHRNRRLPGFDLDMTARTCPDPIGHVIFVEGLTWYASDSPWSIINDPEFDQLYTRIIRTIDLREQTILCHKLEEMVHEKAFSLFSYQGIKLYAMTRRVTYTPKITGALDYKETEISDD
jgi:peptide/nickel transport system substrate-binding protein